MLKKLKLSLLLLCLPFAAMAADFKAGEHYDVLKIEKSKTSQVTEFFSFYCPHCFKFEAVAKAMEKSLPAGTEFVKNHVNFLGGLAPEVQSNLSYAYIIAKQHNKGEQVADQMFDSIHIKRAPLNNIKDVKALLAVNGIDSDTFDKDIASMPVIAAEKAMQDKQNKFSQMGALTGVPTFIVNDKYKININTIKSQEQLDELVAFLLQQ
ncbi:MAG: thiol:disulfide interchange protein DsbA [Pseudoalteromonas rhizosphaerae]|jgi:thiol:disulfide interchange protein DsbA|uniref:Thiol:disulfide interchange protein n=1 Tax=Pseudoalteromonas neustonica TaxID=1840331 RepID=A0ABY3F770_9GAMM|nr:MULTISPECIES: thiol:disulfide interchange protein DsbA/DsbL [Pseudoalteromonas]MBB1295435.1 thiol:disulfide interchange protein DsbA/DsbL [Pseudoalteromonas sp. SR41-4]MBB1303633.1 thiol:disulfide interchange protein DsbA/DsbL [Pseudoalteromonas sp. SR44-8]MBB1311619.1 thiol:disulfide interchange protein DsbA/DsbL [Pseudoalteromonas sp. SR41-8]MBB1399865.1 thiol:disulfide interchange protein DsbA/DsbL [Pseudoalteromonas sp. SG44-8]MBB1411472.1 thiol:disulfide interchange protein DsbA/DsbL [|tara:strand:+ start:5585 stop:6208 length:624 start_codon:yes stop_codon:yes gene_type:complete